MTQKWTSTTDPDSFQTPEAVLWCEAYLAGGVMLVDPELVDKVLRIVGSADFGSRRVQRVWTAVEEVRREGGVPTLPVVALKLLDLGDLDAVGGEPYLTRIASLELTLCYANEVGMVANAAVVRKWGERRRIARKGAAMVRAASAPGPLPNNMINATGRFRGGVSFDVDAV